jgi:hypothetical protein
MLPSPGMFSPRNWARWWKFQKWVVFIIGTNVGPLKLAISVLFSPTKSYPHRDSFVLKVD